MESWAKRLEREKRELEAELPRALALPDDKLAPRLQELARTYRHVFAGSLAIWGPEAWRRDRVRIRPLLLSYANVWVGFRMWEGREPALRAWLDAIEAAGDDELFRALYPHSLGKDRQAQWQKDLLARWEKANPEARAGVLTRFDIGGVLDEPTATRLWETDPTRARAFVIRHLPHRGAGWFEKKPPPRWNDLARRTEHRDPELYFAIYRAQTPVETWHRDVIALAEAHAHSLPPSSGGGVGRADLDAELERRHTLAGAKAPTFTAVLERAGLAGWPYVQRHLGEVFRDAGADALLDLVRGRGWIPAWAAITIRTGNLDKEVARTLADRSLETGESRRRLVALGSFGRATPTLSEGVALSLYRRFPDLLRGPLCHLLPRHGSADKLVNTFLEAGDTLLLDHLASTFVLRWYTPKDTTPNRLAELYAALPASELARRGAAVLSGVPAHGVFAYDQLVRANPLARLLFERAEAYLDDPDAVRDLLESPNIHVQGVAFRLLGRDDPRARAIAVRSVDMLVPTLLRALHSRTRRWAIAALRGAGTDPDAARRIVPAARDAMDLPDARYPKEELVGLLGALLHRWPEFRTPTETPRVYRVGPN